MSSDTFSILLQASHLYKVYHSGDEELEVLKDLDLIVYQNEFLAITGESGSGKSTLLHLLGCLDTPTSGTIHYAGRELSSLGAREQDHIRNHEFGFVFQFHHLLPEFSALENTMLPGMIAHRPHKELKEKAISLLTELRLSHRLSHKPNRLSGGEQQRVAVARAMINAPAILFLDEPTGNLDPAHSDELISLIKQQQRSKHLTVVVVTHNLEIAHTADRHLVLEEGKVKPK